MLCEKTVMSKFMDVNPSKAHVYSCTRNCWNQQEEPYNEGGCGSLVYGTHVQPL